MDLFTAKGAIEVEEPRLYKDAFPYEDFPKNAFICPGRESTCSACGACFNKKLKAVVFHQH